MADSNTADLGKGKRITGGDRSTLADELRKRYDGGESIRSLADVHEPLLRLRPPAAVGVRGDTAQPRWGQPEQQEGVNRGRHSETAGSGRAGTAPS